MTRIRSRAAFVVLAVVLFGLTGAVMSPATAIAKTVTWSSYDVALKLNGDGSFHVTERQNVAFSGGPFSFAYATIPTARMDDLRNIAVSEIRDGDSIAYHRASTKAPESYTVSYSSTDVTINWYMPPTSNESRLFVLEYDVIGGLRVYANDAGPRQQIWWTAIDSDVTDIAPIEQATFTIELPAAIDTSTVIIDGPGGNNVADHTQDGRLYTWSQSNMGSGDSLEVRMEFPALVSAAAPAWQAADDTKQERERDREDRQNLLKLMMAAAALLTATAGGAGLLGLWYTRGRDPGVGAVATYLSEPPDDLPPGAAGALVDEVVDQRDIVATLVDLGNRGVLKITEGQSGSVFHHKTYTIAKQASSTPLRPFESSFVAAMMGSGDSTDLVSAKARFGPQADRIRNEMYAELVSRGYFGVSPETTRSRYRHFSTIGLAILIAVVVFFGGRILGMSGWIILPVIAAGILLLALQKLARYMPRKTFSGAESAAKWRAFKRYLESLDDQKATEGATEIFQKYLPYAVAFGIEHTWVNRFAQAGAPAPDWYTGTGGGTMFGGGQPYRPYRRTGWGGGWVGFPGGTSTGGSGGGDSGGGVDFPDLGDVQEASDRGAGSLQSLSSGLFGLLNSAGSAFESFSGSSGGHHGGFSGGGHSSGGHGGGGGGGGGRGFG